MSRRSSSVFLVFLAVLLCAARPHGSTMLELLVRSPYEGLREQSIDINDTWESARLLAHFGETELAYDALQNGSFDETDDSRRFEARLMIEMGQPARADSILSRPYKSDDSALEYKHNLQRARLNLLDGDVRRALEFIAKTDRFSLPAFDPYRDYVAMECLVLAERYDEAVRVGEKRLTIGVPESLSPSFEEWLLEAYVGVDGREKALQLIETVDAQQTRSSAMAPLLIRGIDLLFETGDTTRAVDRAVELLHDRRTRNHALSIAETVTDRVPLDSLWNDALLEFGRATLHAGKSKGLDGFISVLSRRELEPSRADQFAMLKAELYYKKHRYNRSYSLLRKSFDDASLERTATLLRARIFRKTGQPKRSAAEYVAFAEKYPYDAKAAEALVVAADLYERVGEGERSLELLGIVADTYPSSRHGKTATMKLANYYLARKDFSEAVRVLSLAVDRSRRANEELLYYLAEAYGRMGDVDSKNEIVDELRELDSTSFYLNPRVENTFVHPVIASNGRVDLYGERGLLEFLRIVFEERDRSYKSVRSALDDLSQTTADLSSGAENLERGRAFLEMGFRDWAETELRTLESGYKLPARYWLELGVLYDDYAMHWRSTRAFQRVYYSLAHEERKTLDNHFKLLTHPVPYPALVFENCSRNGLPAHLVYAMMRQESRFDLNAVSAAGAMGLMQLMPATSDQVAGRLGFPKGSHEILFVPEVNLTFGIWYAAHLLSRSDGNLIMMLSAYNAGLGNARRWFRRGDRNAVVAMVDGIDYGETRNYVKRIVESAGIYYDLYFDDNFAGRDPAN